MNAARQMRHLVEHSAVTCQQEDTRGMRGEDIQAQIVEKWCFGNKQGRL